MGSFTSAGGREQKWCWIFLAHTRGKERGRQARVLAKEQIFLFSCLHQPGTIPTDSARTRRFCHSKQHMCPGRTPVPGPNTDGALLPAQLHGSSGTRHYLSDLSPGHKALCLYKTQVQQCARELFAALR